MVGIRGLRDKGLGFRAFLRLQKQSGLKAKTAWANRRASIIRIGFWGVIIVYLQRDHKNTIISK